MLEGGCSCGDLRYRLDPEEAVVDVCHCGQCKRASGAAFLAWVQVAPERFQVTRGDAACYESSPGMKRFFCLACGTPTHMADERGLSVGVTLGSLDNPEALVPAAHGYFAFRLSWLRLGDDWARFDEAPPYDEHGE
jgi:hypothetical protein